MVQTGDYIIGFGNDTTIGLNFDDTIDVLKRQQNIKLKYTFFRGSKEQLMGRKMPLPAETTVTITVVQGGKPEIKLQCPGGTNIRELLVNEGINVYRSVTRWTNCKGKQRCGTCIVDIVNNDKNGLTRKSLNEGAALMENPESYRLSCITNVYEDITLEVQGPIGEAAVRRIK
jgi:ferredoxin